MSLSAKSFSFLKKHGFYHAEVTLFQAQKVHRETLAAVQLFQKAAERETVTVDLVRRLQAYLAETRSSPRGRFEG